MGSAQREATIVAVGLVIVATLVIVYLFNEPMRREAAAEQKVEESAERGVELYAQFCVQCHGPDGKAIDRIGIPLNTEQNQTDDETLWEQREQVIYDAIAEGRGEIMPAWSQEEEGPLNTQQIQDLVNLIHLGAWDEVYEAVLEMNDGVIPTPEPLPTPEIGVELDEVAQQGQEIYVGNCAGCHPVDETEGTAPTWWQLYGSEVPLEDGTTVVADEDYIRESIVDPNAKIHEGYPPIMPSFEGRLTDEQIDAVVAYIQALGTDAGGEDVEQDEESEDAPDDTQEETGGEGTPAAGDDSETEATPEPAATP